MILRVVLVRNLPGCDSIQRKEYGEAIRSLEQTSLREAPEELPEANVHVKMPTVD